MIRMHHFRSLVFILPILGTLIFAQARQRTDHWHLRNGLFNSELDSVPRHGNVFFGDSIIEGFDLEHYFPGHVVINRGIVGDHLDGLIERLNNSVVALQPERVFLMIGINDIGDKRDDDYLKSMYVTLLDTLQKTLPETEIYLHSMLPTSARWKNCPPAQIKRMNAFLAVLALERGIKFVNLYSYFLSGMEYLNPELSRDGLHPNQVGYDLWAREIRPYLE